MGLGNIKKMFGYGSVGNPIASYGKMTEVSTGKDSTSWSLGNWWCCLLILNSLHIQMVFQMN